MCSECTLVIDGLVDKSIINIYGFIFVCSMEIANEIFFILIIIGDCSTDLLKTKSKNTIQKLPKPFLWAASTET